MALDVKKLPSRLKRWRKTKKVVQAVAAEHFEVSLGTYRNWEQGRKLPDRDIVINAIEQRMTEPIAPPPQRRRKNASSKT